MRQQIRFVEILFSVRWYVEFVLQRKCELGRWSSSAREWMGREEEGVGEKVDPYPLICADETASPHQPGKTRLSPKRRNQWRGWVTHTRIDEIPVIRGHDLCFDKTCQ